MKWVQRVKTVLPGSLAEKGKGKVSGQRKTASERKDVNS